MLSMHNKQFSQFWVLHRHLLVSCCVCLQAFKGTLAKGLRQNLSQVMLWSNKNKEMSKSICEEFANFISAEKLQKAWDYATSKSPYDFLCLDFYATDPRFKVRRCLHEAILIDDMEDEPQ